jgi:hypothetical protein
MYSILLRDLQLDKYLVESSDAAATTKFDTESKLGAMLDPADACQKVGAYSSKVLIS